jgi:hypothetical protein
MATRFVIDLISDDPRLADYLRSLLDDVTSDYHFGGELVTAEYPLVEGEDEQAKVN